MSPNLSELTPEQRETVNALQAELRDLELQADEEWAKYIQTGDLDCYNQVLALDGEREMKGLIAYIPRAGEQRIGKIRGLVNRIRNSGSETPVGPLHWGNINFEARLRTLETVNDFRKELGLPEIDRLPPGVLGDGARCTIAQALRIGWDEHPQGWKLNDVSVGGSSGTVEFYDGHGQKQSMSAPNTQGWDVVVSNFDGFKYPDLEGDDLELVRRVDSLLEEGRTYEDDDLRFALREVVRRGLVADLLEEQYEFGLRYDPAPADPEDRWSVVGEEAMV